MTQPSEQDLQWLLALIQGKSFPYSKGLVSHDTSDPGQQGLHRACLILERQGHIVRHDDGGPGTAWLPVEAHA